MNIMEIRLTMNAALPNNGFMISSDSFGRNESQRRLNKNAIPDAQGFFALTSLKFTFK